MTVIYFSAIKCWYLQRTKDDDAEAIDRLDALALIEQGHKFSYC
jgi:hypothetical protein